MKRIKLLAAATMISLSTLSMVACQKTEPEIKIQTDIQGTGIGEYKGDIEVTPVAPQTPQRTVIENGEVKVWAETFNRDETIKPIKYEALTDKAGIPGHYIYYNVDGHEIKVAVNEKSGDRYFYKDGKSYTFAQIGKSVKDSNENILLQVKINDMIIENTKKKYK